jgi:putative glutamine amidotransferase
MKIVLAIDPGQPHASYRDALLAAGARPGEVEIVRPGDPLPEEFDGLLLAGGVDVDPVRYGEAPVNATVETNAGRDVLDFELFARAGRNGAAVFGICRGLQVVNVALGGTLWQDLPTQRPHGVRHSFDRREGFAREHLAHSVRAARVAPALLPFARIVAEADGALVNSRHHQAVKDLAPGLVPLAASPDDLVEAFAREAGPFLAAVQWHPENLVQRADQKALFEEFFDAARRRGANRRPSVPLASSPETPADSPRVPSHGTATGGGGNHHAPPGSEGRNGGTARPGRPLGEAPEPS